MPIELEQNTDPKKQLLYGLCQFLIQQKLLPKNKGRNRPITTSITEISDILKSSGFGQELTYDKLEEELRGLTQETDQYVRPLLEISSGSIGHNSPDEPLLLKYQRSEIENYIEYLREGDRIRTEGDEYNKILFKHEHGKTFFTYKGKRMIIRSKEPWSIRKNICLLMYGMSATWHRSPRGNRQGGEAVTIFSEYPNYQLGDQVNFDVLTQLILIREDETNLIDEAPNRERLPRGDRNKKIRDAILDLNELSQKKFKKDIFIHEDQQVWIKYPPT